MRRKVSVPSLLAVIIFIVFILIFWATQIRYSPRRVLFPPSGFIPLSVLDDDAEGSLSYVFWETQISFLVADNHCIYQTSVRNRSFIVEYKNEYFINEATYLAMLDIIEQRDRIHGLGDVIELPLQEGSAYTFTVLNVELSELEHEVRYEIKFKIEPDVSKNEIKSFFDHVEIENGMKYDRFYVVDTETIRVYVPKDEKICVLVVRSPSDYRNIRKVGIGE